MNSKFVKIVGFALSVIGCIVTLASNYIDEKKMDLTIQEKIEAALKEANK